MKKWVKWSIAIIAIVVFVGAAFLICVVMLLRNWGAIMEGQV